MRFGRWSAAGAIWVRADTNPGSAKALEAVTLGDSKGDAATAAATLDRAVMRSSAALASERIAALVYRAELAMSLGDRTVALASLDARRAITTDAADRDIVAADIERGLDLTRQLDG